MNTNDPTCLPEPHFKPPETTLSRAWMSVVNHNFPPAHTYSIIVLIPSRSLLGRTSSSLVLLLARLDRQAQSTQENYSGVVQS